jgi:hypothetical protein
VAVSKVGEMDKAKETFKPGELSQIEFRRRVLKTLREYYREKYKSDFDFVAKTPEKENTLPDFIAERVKEPVAQLEFEKLTYSAPTEGKEVTTFFLYFYRNGTNQIALIYQLPDSMTKDPRFLQGMSYSLKSVDISERAIEKKQDYVRTHRPVVAKKG